MTRLILILLLIPSFATAQTARSEKAWELERELSAVLADAAAEVEAVAELAAAMENRGARRELRNKVDSLRRLLEAARVIGGDLGGIATASPQLAPPAPAVTVIVQEPPPLAELTVIDPGPQACDSGDFNRVFAAVDGESFASEQLAVLGQAARDRWFSVDQVITLLGIFSFGKDQVEAGAVLFPRVVDEEEWYRVYGAFTFDSDKDKLRARVGR